MTDVDQDRLATPVERIVNDLGGAPAVPLAVIGVQLAAALRVPAGGTGHPYHQAGGVASRVKTSRALSHPIIRRRAVAREFAGIECGSAPYLFASNPHMETRPTLV
jgi:hypothetical protein